MAGKVIFTITGAGSYSREVMDHIAGQLQKYLYEREEIVPDKVLVLFNMAYLAQTVFVPKTEKELECVKMLRQVLITVNVPIVTFRTKAKLKLFLDTIFGVYGNVVFTDPYEIVKY